MKFALEQRARRMRRAQCVMSIVVVIGLAACGGGGGGGGGSSPLPTTPTPSVPGSSPGAAQNSAPSISGAPRRSVMHGSAYEFVPAASDRDGDRLTFTASNLPRWAACDPQTGRIHGTPTAADLGSYRGVTISVSDGSSAVALPPFDIEVVATALGTATLRWLPPLERTDGSALTNLAGYVVYWGTRIGDYDHSVRITNPGITSYMVENLTPATWYFVVTAFDASGIESDFSGVGSKTIR